MSDESIQKEETMAEDLATAGVIDTAIGASELDAAGDTAAVAAAATAAGASDLTRAVDAEVVASRLADLSEIVSDAGALDIAEGVEMLTASGIGVAYQAKRVVLDTTPYHVRHSDLATLAAVLGIATAP